MIASWWSAHKLEFLVTAGLLALVAMLWLVEQVSEIREEWRQRRKDGLL